MVLAGFGWLVGSFDFNAFLRAAGQVRIGRSPYSSVHSVAFLTGHAFVYPYLVAWVYVPLTVLSPVMAAGANVAASVIAIVIGCHLLGRPGLYPAALVVVSSTTIIGLQMGTLNAFLFLGLAVGWSQRRRVVVAGAAIGFVAVSKLFLLPIMVWLIATRRFRAAGVAAGVFAAALGVGWVVGPVGADGYRRLLTSLAGKESLQSWSLSSFVQSAGLGVRGTEVVVLVAVGLVLCGGYIGLRRTGDERIMFALAVIACLFASPIVWSSYLVLVAVPVLVVATNDRSMAVVAVASWVLVTPDSASPGRIVLGAGLAIVVAVAATRRDLAAVPARWAAIRGWPGAKRADHLNRYALGVVVAGLSVAAFSLLPGSERNAIPALAGVAAVGMEAVRHAPWRRRSSPAMIPEV